MDAHPVQLRVTDDLRRSRLTVFFRILLAIPHYVWFALWSIAAVLAAIANWFATLATGRPPASLHRFLSIYVRYATHLNGYLWLAADPYPPFGGNPGYVFDLELPAEPPEQPRWKTALRIVLVLPALFLGAFLGGALIGPSASFYGPKGKRGSYGGGFSSGALTISASFLGWFASLVRGRMPKGLRDAIAYGIGYGAQTIAYLFLVTDRYPNADPYALLEDVAPPPEHPVTVHVDDDLRRSRITVFFRLPLAVPHIVWLGLWTIVALVSGFVQWFAVLFTRRGAAPLHRFLSAYVRYTAHVSAFLYLVANPFPGFVGEPGRYPLDVTTPGIAPQSRVVTLFRAFLALPAWLVSTALSYALLAAGVLTWFVALAFGRAPLGLRNLGVYAIRYAAQFNAYVYLVTDRYPHASPLEGRAASEPNEPESLPAA